MGKLALAEQPTGSSEVVFREEPGGKIALLFDDEAALLEIRISPSTTGKFEPWRVMPDAPRYLAHACAMLAASRGEIAAAMHALRQICSTRRGLSDDFLRLVSQAYGALLAEGKPYPVKALAEMQAVNISTASRWIKAARERGFISGAADA